MALLALAGFLVAVGIGGVSSGRLARWMSWSAVVIGATLAIGVAVAQTGLADIASLLALRLDRRRLDRPAAPPRGGTLGVDGR